MKKESPCWKLEELLKPKPGVAVVGLKNRDTTLSTQEGVKIWEQVEVERSWIEERLENGHITPDTASKLGLQALAHQMDNIHVKHLQDFIKKSKNEAVALEQKIGEEIGQLGCDPAEIALDNLKKYVKLKLQESLPLAKKEMEDKRKDLFKKEIDITKNCADGKDPSTEKCIGIARDLFLGGQFGLEAEFIMATIINKAFDEDSTGEMQIARFEGLRKHYVEVSESLAAEYFRSFSKRVSSLLNLFEDLVWIKGKFGGSNAVPSTILNPTTILCCLQMKV